MQKRQQSENECERCETMSEKRKKGDDFDWVAARWNCSLTMVFEKLKAQVKSDVENIKSRRGISWVNEIEFTNNGNNFVVCLATASPGNILDAVGFTLKENEILITDKRDGELFRAIPSIDDDGDCILKVGEKECELWQVRKKALEKLFFRAA